MRIATWNVNSLKARQEAVEHWLERAAPDVLLIQETKLTDGDAPVHGLRDGRLRPPPPRRGALERRRRSRPARGCRSTTSSPTSATGRCATAAPASTEGLRRGRLQPVRRGADARARRSTASGSSASTRPNGRVVGSPFYAGKLAWYERLARWLAETARASGDAGHRRRLQHRPDRRRRLGRQCRPRRDARLRAGARGVPGAPRLGPDGRATGPARRRPAASRWWDYRAGNVPQEPGHADRPPPGDGAGGRSRLVDAEIDREARKGPPIPSDHAPLLVDLDEPGRPFDADWDGALARIAARSRPSRARR